MRHEAAGNEVTVGVAWLWCVAGCLAWWVSVAWAVERVVEPTRLVVGGRVPGRMRMTDEQDTALIAAQLADLTQTVGVMAKELQTLRERTHQQVQRADIQQDRIDIAARELGEVSDRLQAAANALRQSV